MSNDWVTLRKDFHKWLQEEAKTDSKLDSEENEKIGDKKAVLEYSNKFQEFLKTQENSEENFTKNTIDLNDEDNENFLDEIFNDYTSGLKKNSKEFKAIDSNNDGKISSKEKKNFFNSIKNLDKNDKNITFSDFSKAIDKFDTSYNVQFSTYAVPVIAGEIKRFLRDDGPIKMSRSIKDNLYKIKKAREKIAYCNEKEATVEELVEETGLSKEEILISLEADIEVESINKTVYSHEDNNTTIGDRIPNKYDEMERAVNSIYIQDMLKKLEERERRLIELRYFHNKKQAEVAKVLGISQVQVSRIEKKVLLRLREM